MRMTDKQVKEYNNAVANQKDLVNAKETIVKIQGIISGLLYKKSSDFDLAFTKQTIQKWLVELERKIEGDDLVSDKQTDNDDYVWGFGTMEEDFLEVVKEGTKMTIRFYGSEVGITI